MVPHIKTASRAFVIAPFVFFSLVSSIFCPFVAAFGKKEGSSFSAAPVLPLVNDADLNHAVDLAERLFQAIRNGIVKVEDRIRYLSFCLVHQILDV